MASRNRDVPIERRFIGTIRLVTLHLWRVAKSTDIEECFSAARELRMLASDDEKFIRDCMLLNDRLEAGEDIKDEISPEMIGELQKCALRLNSADPA